MKETQESLSAALWAARVDGTILPKPEETLLGDGYAVQSEIVEHSGEKQIGWKVGSTSTQAQARLGTTEPGAGALLERYCFQDGDEVPVFESHGPAVEVEFAFTLATSLEPRDVPYSRVDLEASVSRCHPALELVGSRFTGGLEAIGRSLITADGGGNIAFVQGPSAATWRDVNLAEITTTLRKNGKVLAKGTGQRALEHPLNVMVWLANHCSSRGLTLQAGDIVTTGTCTGLIPVSAGDHLIGEFGALGAVSATIITAD